MRIVSAAKLMADPFMTFLSRRTLSERKLIVLTFEGLVTSALGCYGSSWNSTPAVDRLASLGCVWDRWIAPSDDPREVFKRWMQTETGGEDWLHPWRHRGRTDLITDDPSLIELGFANGFDDSCLIQQLDPLADRPAEEIEATQLGQMVATAIDRSSRSPPWSLLWLHSRFLTQRWDAPRLMDDLGEESVVPNEDVELLQFEPTDELVSIPPVFEQVTPPQLRIEETSHPDLITSWMTTYGCQIQLIDDLIGVMLQAMDGQDTVVVLASTSGFSLGQNGWIGHRAGPLRSCHARLPLIISCDGPLRSMRLSSTDCLPELIRQLADPSRPLIDPDQWIQTDAEFEPRIVTQGDGRYAVTTPNWFLVCADQQQELFLKPDDVEDANNVSRLRTEVVNRIVDD